MGKRSDFKRVERDFYPTPFRAVEPLFKFMENSGYSKLIFAEPCAGDNALVEHLETCDYLECGYKSDIEPNHKKIIKKDIFDLKRSDVKHCDIIITNPPWDRKLLHAMIDHLATLKLPFVLLFDADWPHTKQSIPHMKHLEFIIPVGRLKWIPDSPHTGKDNCCWYWFDPEHNSEITGTYFLQRTK